MTTRLTAEANPRLPRPDAYTPYTDRILADPHARGPLPRRLWLVVVLLTILGTACLATLYFQSP